MFCQGVRPTAIDMRRDVPHHDSRHEDFLASMRAIIQILRPDTPMESGLGVLPTIQNGAYFCNQVLGRVPGKGRLWPT